MTREEAKEIIIKERDSLKANPTVKVDDCLYEAFDVAIKALEQEDVLDKIRAEIEEERKGYPPSAEYYKAIVKVLHILDKYKAESEDEE